MQDRYIVGVDGSGPSRAAIRWGLERASLSGASVLLLHVRGETPDRMDDDTLIDLARRATAADAHAEVHAAAVDGPVVRAMIDIANESDLIVIGTHKTGHLHGRALGTRALAITAAASCSVAVIPETDLRFRRGIVAGIGDDDAHAVIAAAATEARRRAEELVLVRASAPFGDGGTTSDALAAVADGVRRRDPDLTVSYRTTASGPAPGLLDAAIGHALLVIGSAPQPAPRDILSPVLHDVLINLTAPVLVAREQTRTVTPNNQSKGA